MIHASQRTRLLAVALLSGTLWAAAADTEQPAAQEQPATTTEEGRLSDNLEVGKSVFTTKCVRCHANSRFGSPRLKDHKAWRERLKQGEQTLIQHALKGHGLMPPKGGFRSLTDEEIKAAVSYVVSRARIYADEPEPAGASPCAEDLNAPDCPPKERRRRMILQILWLLGNPR